MSELMTIRPSEAIKPDGFVDFYELLGLPQTSGDDALRERINALYTEAQANRDHRNLNKRRDYELLLELLPFARTVLLDAPKRQRYDVYAEDARAGLAGMDFETFMNTLTGKADSDSEERASLLGVADTGTRDTAPVASLNGTATAAPRPAAKPLPRPSATSAAPPTPAAAPQRSVSPAAQAGLMGSAASVGLFVVGLLIGGIALKSWPIGLVAGGILGAVTWFATHKKSATKVS